MNSGEEVTDDERRVWAKIIERAYKIHHDMLPSGTAKQILSSPAKVKVLLNIIQVHVLETIDLADSLENENTMYDKLMETKDRLMKEKGFDEVEALVAAWYDRQFLIAPLVKEHKAILVEALGQDDTSSEESDD